MGTEFDRHPKLLFKVTLDAIEDATDVGDALADSIGAKHSAELEPGNVTRQHERGNFAPVCWVV